MPIRFLSSLSFCGQRRQMMGYCRNPGSPGVRIMASLGRDEHSFHHDQGRLETLSLALVFTYYPTAETITEYHHDACLFRHMYPYLIYCNWTASKREIRNATVIYLYSGELLLCERVYIYICIVAYASDHN